MTGNAGKISAPETRRCLESVKLAPGHANHAVTPKSIPIKIRLGLQNRLFLFAMIFGSWLNHESLLETSIAGPKSSTVAVEIDFVGHVVVGPDTVALTTIQA